MYVTQIALAVLAAVICVFLIITLVKNRPLVQKVNNIIMEASMKEKVINYNRIIYIVIALLAITVIMSAMNVYTYVTVSKLEAPAINTNQTVNVNVNSEDDSGRIDLNTASKEDLVALPGVGEVLANRILAARPFYSVEQLKDIEGIGEVIYVKLRGLVKVVGYD